MKCSGILLYSEKLQDARYKMYITKLVAFTWFGFGTLSGVILPRTAIQTEFQGKLPRGSPDSLLYKGRIKAAESSNTKKQTEKKVPIVKQHIPNIQINIPERHRIVNGNLPISFSKNIPSRQINFKKAKRYENSLDVLNKNSNSAIPLLKGQSQFRRESSKYDKHSLKEGKDFKKPKHVRTFQRNFKNISSHSGKHHRLHSHGKINPKLRIKATPSVNSSSNHKHLKSVSETPLMRKSVIKSFHDTLVANNRKIVKFHESNHTSPENSSASILKMLFPFFSNIHNGTQEESFLKNGSNFSYFTFIKEDEPKRRTLDSAVFYMGGPEKKGSTYSRESFLSFLENHPNILAQILAISCLIIGIFLAATYSVAERRHKLYRATKSTTASDQEDSDEEIPKKWSSEMQNATPNTSGKLNSLESILNPVNEFKKKSNRKANRVKFIHKYTGKMYRLSSTTEDSKWTHTDTKASGEDDDNKNGGISSVKRLSSWIYERIFGVVHPRTEEPPTSSTSYKTNERNGTRKKKLRFSEEDTTFHKERKTPCRDIKTIIKNSSNSSSEISPQSSCPSSLKRIIRQGDNKKIDDMLDIENWARSFYIGHRSNKSFKKKSNPILEGMDKYHTPACKKMNATKIAKEDSSMWDVASKASSVYSLQKTIKRSINKAERYR